MASLVPPNYVCPRADDVVLYLDSFFICWLVLESLPVKRDSFPCLISLTFAVLLFFSSREKKKASREFCVLSVGVSAVPLHEMKDGSF